MFINCPYCRALVATDPATDRPPPHCPDCGGPLGASDDVRAAAADVVPQPSSSTHTVETSGAANLTGPEHFSMLAETAFATESRQEQIGHGAEPETIESIAAVSATTDTQAMTAKNADAGRRASSPVRGARVAPSFVRAPVAAASRRQAPFSIVAVVALSLLLVLQLLLADRARLAMHARWRPLLEFVCGALSCSLPPWREPAAFTLVQRNVRQHPTVRGALRVTATFRNDARWPQPWPRLQLSLADVDGRLAGMRVFEAHEYLGGAPGQAELGSGESAAVAMDVLEPAPNIVAYDFRFR